MCFTEHDIIIGHIPSYKQIQVKHSKSNYRKKSSLEITNKKSMNKTPATFMKRRPE